MLGGVPFGLTSERDRPTCAMLWGAVRRTMPSEERDSVLHYWMATTQRVGLGHYYGGIPSGLPGVVLNRLMDAINLPLVRL
jgi:hypothetical protein